VSELVLGLVLGLVLAAVLVLALVLVVVWVWESEWAEVRERAQLELVLVEEKVEVLEPGQSQRLQPE
jgi:hypothetical protein